MVIPIRNTEPYTKARLSSPVPPITPTAYTDLSPRNDLDQPSLDNLRALTDDIYLPRSRHLCSSTTAIRDGCNGNGLSFTELEDTDRDWMAREAIGKGYVDGVLHGPVE